MSVAYRFNDISIRNKLLLAFTCVLAGLLLVGAVAYVSLARLGASVVALTDQSMPREAATTRILLSAQRYRTSEFAHISALTPNDQKPIEDDLDKEEAAIETALNALDTLFKGSDEQALLADVRAHWGVYRQYFRKEIMPISREALGNIAVRNLLGEHQQKFLQMQRSLGDLAARSTQEAKGTAEYAVGQQQTAKVTIVAVCLALVALGVLFAHLVAHAISGPLSEAVRVAKAVAGGDLTQRLRVQSRDELGQLLNALNDMTQHLTQMVSHVREGTSEIALASAEIAAGNSDLSARTERQASSLEETAATMEQITEATQLNSQSAQRANDLSLKASKVAVQGGDAVKRVIDTMGRIQQSSRMITDIIGTIDNIAFQTNILALNAAVEAARAGDQGRGFAVVASEVRGLASRCAEAARQIKQLIMTSTEQVEHGGELVNDAGQTIAQVVQFVGTAAKMVEEIANSSEQQADSIAQMNEAFNDLDTATQQNSALVEETSAAAQSLRVQAARLVEVVSVFRTDASTSAPALPFVGR